MEGSLSISHNKRILEIPLSNSCLMKAVLITNIMNTDLLRRKRLWRNLWTPNYHILVLPSLLLLVALKDHIINLRITRSLLQLYMKLLTVHNLIRVNLLLHQLQIQ